VIWPVLAILLCVLVEGFFSGSEIGFYSVNRLRLRSRVEAGWPGAAVLERLLDRPDATMMTTLIGTNLMVYAASALATALLGMLPHAEFLATLALTPVIFVVGEMIPKDLFHRQADTLMYYLAGPLDALRLLLSPITNALSWLIRLFVKPRPGQRGVMFSRAALREWLAEGRREGVLSDYQHDLSANVMDLLQKDVSAAMTPLDAAHMVKAELSGDALRTALREPGHSRLPVYEGARENIVGILHTLDYICCPRLDVTARSLVRDAVKVGRRSGIQAVLVTLQRERQQMAVVVDEEGRPAGVVTVKDLVEEIVGELEDF